MQPIRKGIENYFNDNREFDSLSLSEAEEAGGELQRRIASLLRRLGEQHADATDTQGRSPRWRLASLATAFELASATLGAISTGGFGPTERSDLNATAIAAVMYAAPTIPALLSRLEQNRRLLASLARALESRIAEEHSTPWGEMSLHRMVTQVSLAEPARCVQALEAHTPDT